MFFRAARLQGVSAFQLSNLRTYIEDHRQGAFEYGAPTDVVPMLTGQPAEDLEATVRRYVARPFAQRTPGNRLRALTQFALVPFVPGYDLRHHEQTHGYPRPTRPDFVMASSRWRAEHSPG